MEMNLAEKMRVAIQIADAQAELYEEWKIASDPIEFWHEGILYKLKFVWEHKKVCYNIIATCDDRCVCTTKLI